jgi:RNA polymerase sigma-70 factor (ECF subfamily)
MPSEPGADILDRLSRVAHAERASLAALARSEGLRPEDAVDCVQEGLVTLLDLTQTGKLDPSVNPAAALATIVRNAARNRRRLHATSKPHDDIDAREPPDPDLVLQEDALGRAEELVRLRACVAELCEIQRAVVTLRMLEERAGEDVAEVLGISKNHVAVLLFRAKHALRACMTA